MFPEQRSAWCYLLGGLRGGHIDSAQQSSVPIVPKTKSTNEESITTLNIDGLIGQFKTQIP